MHENLNFSKKYKRRKKERKKEENLETFRRMHKHDT